MDVIEVKNPAALDLTPVQALFKRGFENRPLLIPYGYDSIIPDLYRFVVNDQCFMVLGAEQGQFRSFVLGWFPVGNISPYPTVVLFYNEGSKALLEATKRKLLDILLEHGYTQMFAVNASGHTDDAWMKVLTPDGVSSRLIGSLALFEVE